MTPLVRLTPAAVPCGRTADSLVRLHRILRHARGPGCRVERVWQVLRLMLGSLACDTAGGVAACAWGVGDAVHRSTDLDFHRERFLNAPDRELYDAVS